MAEIRADMVANVMEIYVAVGDAVNVGDTIVLLESIWANLSDYEKNKMRVISYGH